jgi:signal transduction histidine kinase
MAHALEVLVKHLDTRSYFVGSFNITPVKMRGGTQILSAVTIRDITSQKESEHALRRSEKLAATGRLAASIAHEINNPLAAITNLLFLLQGCNDKSSEAKAYLELAQKELQRVSHITKQTLAFYRETNVPVHVNMNNLMREVIEILSSPAVASGIKIEADLSAKNTPRAFAGEVRQVLTNLVANAIDASPSGTTIHVRVRDIVDPRNLSARGVSVLIQDCGKGIPRQLYSQLFQPFVSTKGQKGTGLGLWVTKSIVERHEGFIRYRSSTRPGHSGTCFLVFFRETSSISDKSDTFATLFREIGRELLAETTGK